MLQNSFCEQCGIPMSRQAGSNDRWLCSSCQAGAIVATLSPADVARLRAALHHEGKIAAIAATCRLLDIPLRTAVDIIAVLIAETPAPE
jgi:hypothetical protein